MIWHIGNIIPIDETGLYFRVGRTSKSTIEVYKDGNFVDTAILTILVTLVFWALAGLSVFDLQWPTPSCRDYYFTVKIFLDTLCSLTLRECWHVVLGAQWMLLAQREIRQQKRKENEE